MSQEWFDDGRMDFVGEEGHVWNNYCRALKISHIRIKTQ